MNRRIVLLALLVAAGSCIDRSASASERADKPNMKEASTFPLSPSKSAAGKVDNRLMISAVDLLPTFCQIAGAELPDTYEHNDLKEVKPEIVGQLAERLSQWKSSLPAKPDARNLLSLRNSSLP